MDAGAAEFVPVAIITSLYHVKQAAGRTVSRVIIDGKYTTPSVHTHAKWIPKTAGDLLQLIACGSAAKYSSSYPLGAYDFFTVRANHRVRMPEVFAEAEDEFSL